MACDGVWWLVVMETGKSASMWAGGGVAMETIHLTTSAGGSDGTARLSCSYSHKEATENLRYIAGIQAQRMTGFFRRAVMYKSVHKANMQEKQLVKYTNNAKKKH